MLKNTIKRWFIPAEKRISELEDMSKDVENKMMYKIQKKIGDINDTSRIYNIYLMDYSEKIQGEESIFAYIMT